MSTHKSVEFGLRRKLEAWNCQELTMNKGWSENSLPIEHHKGHRDSTALVLTSDGLRHDLRIAGPFSPYQEGLPASSLALAPPLDP